MVGIWPRTMICEPRGKSFLLALMIGSISRATPPKIAALHRAVNVDDRLNVVVRNHAHLRAAAEGSQARP